MSLKLPRCPMRVKNPPGTLRINSTTGTLKIQKSFLSFESQTPGSLRGAGARIPIQCLFLVGINMCKKFDSNCSTRIRLYAELCFTPSTPTPRALNKPSNQNKKALDLIFPVYRRMYNWHLKRVKYTLSI